MALNEVASSPNVVMRELSQYLTTTFICCRYGTQNLSLKTYIQPIVELLGDPTSSVRDAAIQTLVEIYKHVGDKLRADLRKKSVPPAKLALLEQKFDEVKSDDLLLPSAFNNHNVGGGGGEGGLGNDDLDTCLMPRPTRLMKRSPSARRPIMDNAPPSAPNGDSGGVAGSVSISTFEMSFEIVPRLTIFASRDIEEHMKSIIKIIGDKTMDWEKRVDAVSFNWNQLLMVVILTFFCSNSAAKEDPFTTAPK